MQKHWEDLERIQQQYEQISLKNSLNYDLYNQITIIHPFGDGNGRTSRLLMNYIQLYHNQPLSIVFKDDKAEYIQVLRETRNTEDISSFHKFMIQQHIKFLQNQIDSFQNGAKDDLILGK
jgi:fido (protein-threonine AMPylation protein)